MSKTIRCAIIGCGVIAPTHLRSYRCLDGVEVAWLCDLVEAKARKLAQEHDVAAVTKDYREVLADPAVDVVSVCTDHASHAPITVAALEAGKHVLCEKALAARPEGLARMLEAHERRPDLIFGGVFQHRFEPFNQLIKQLVDDGSFGRLLTASVHVRCLRTPEYYRADRWRGTWDEEGGAVLINQAIHFLDLLLWITGGADAVSGAYANLTHGDAMETEDTVTASLRLRSGALATAEATCSSHLPWEPTIEIHGTQGSIEFRGDRPLKVLFTDPDLTRRIEADLARAVDPAGVHLGKRHYGPAHPGQIADFIDAIREGRPPFVTARSAAHTVSTVFAIYESHRAARWIDVQVK